MRLETRGVAPTSWPLGTVWPPILQYAFDNVGWRATYVGLGCFCTATMLLLALVLRRRPPDFAVYSGDDGTALPLMLLGGEPMDGPRHIWWNFVSSRKDRIEQAKAEWTAGHFQKVPGDEIEHGAEVGRAAHGRPDN